MFITEGLINIILKVLLPFFRNVLYAIFWFSGLMFIGTPCNKNVKKYHLSANNTAHQATSMDSNSNLQSAELCT